MTRVPDLPAGISVEKLRFLADLVAAFGPIPGVVAVVRGDRMPPETSKRVPI